LEAFFYVNKTIENSWSRAVLTHQIESGLFKREGKAISNFSKTLPSPNSNIVQEMIKNPYNFDFVALSNNFTEKELPSTKEIESNLSKGELQQQSPNLSKLSHRRT